MLVENYKGILQTDGYQVYAAYAKNLPQCTHALCWAHTRRAFLKAETIDPQPMAKALEMIRAMYAIESELRQAGASQEAILARRKADSEPTASRQRADRGPVLRVGQG